MEAEKLEKLFQYVNEKAKSPQQRRFKMRSFFDGHLSIFQDLNGVRLSVAISRDGDFEHDWLFSIQLLFWGFEIGWNGKFNDKQESQMADEIKQMYCDCENPARDVEYVDSCGKCGYMIKE